MKTRYFLDKREKFELSTFCLQFKLKNKGIVANLNKGGYSY